MTRSSIPLRLPGPLMQAAQRLAKQDGVSLDQWIAIAVAQQIGSVEATDAFFKERTGEARPEDLRWFLDNAPDVPPMPGDELPEGYIRKRGVSDAA